jgi:enamine deaminase RidA (YjgF/YER057c/UK114 family)
MPLQRLAELGLALPTPPTPIGVYVPAIRTGNLLFVSGQLPLIDGQLPPEYTGKLGGEVALAAGQAAACQATLNALAIVQAAVGLAAVQRIVRLAGHVNSRPDFTLQPQVLNAASDLLGAVLGEAGVHARLALGAAALPLDACVELELIVEVEGSPA